MRSTHALTVNGQRSFDLSEAVRPVKEQLARNIERLDANERYSLALWRLPEGMLLNDVDLTREPQEYLQCAGSADRMTIEIREQRDGQALQSVLGHGPPAEEGEPTAVVDWDGHATKVHPNEIFAVPEAVRIFASYLDHHDVDPSYHRRPLAL